MGVAGAHLEASASAEVASFPSTPHLLKQREPCVCHWKTGATYYMDVATPIWQSQSFEA